LKINDLTLKNTSTICTVFEGHYHKGVAGLVNSLQKNGYEGVVWAGYKGNLPPWARIDSSENGVEKMSVSDAIALHFVKLSDATFLPYCKPDFMLDILENKMPDLAQIFFFDCDIIVKCRFSYFEEWALCGVALCEDVNSPLPISHPLRFQWVDYFKKYGILVNRRDNYYVNGGFIGLNVADKDILEQWRLVQNLMLEELKEVKSIGFKDRTNPFHRTDQDALNIAKDITDRPLSIADGTAMDLSNYGFIMSHAVGNQKPWQKNWISFVIKHGQRPTMTDKLFMQHTEGPLSIFTKNERFLKRWNLKIASALGRILA
jgi:hypothetical protein